MIYPELPNAPSRSAPTLPGQVEALFRDLRAMAIVLGNVALACRQAFISAADKADQDHLRAERLAAYRRRHSWKKSDIQKLETLKVSPVARNRMERATGTGRPIVRAHEPLGSHLAIKFRAIQTLVDPNSTPHDREIAFKLSPWWPHYVEALYRGEHSLAKEAAVVGPSVHSESAVGQALGISAATVHGLCGQIRRKRKEWDGAANFPAMTLGEYRNWMATGKHPRIGRP